MITIYLCDDNEILLRTYKNKISDIANENRILVSIKTFISGEQLLFHLEDKTDGPDIIYMDIMMGGLNGIETSKKLRASDCQAELIFLTSSDKYALDSFDAYPLHYIMKGTTGNEKFEEILLHALKLVQQKKKDIFTCGYGGVVKRIPVNTISYFEVHNRITTVFFSNTNFDFYSTIEKLESELSGKGFIRCHRSFLISLNHIAEISKNTVTTIDGLSVPVGPNYLRSLKLAFSATLANF